LRNPIALAIGAIILLILVGSTVTIVPETRQGVIVRFGEPKQIINRYRPNEDFGKTGAGVILRVPFFDQIVWIDKRVLSVEMDELFIQAGLQDRVIQCYEGCMFMNFERSLVEGRGYGEYERLPVANLPYLWLAYLSDPSNSGKIHSNVKARWLAGDPVIHEGMKRFAQLTDEGRTALLDKDWPTLGRLMSANFALRRQLYGDDCIGQAALAMIAVAQEAGVPVKFPGSGGAVVGMCESDAQRQHVRELYESRGYVFAALVPHEPSQP
jgi:glucuronokinase